MSFLPGSLITRDFKADIRKMLSGCGQIGNDITQKGELYTVQLLHFVAEEAETCEDGTRAPVTVCL